MVSILQPSRSFGSQHKHLQKELREGIVGGPSIIFHRYHEEGVTKIRNENGLPCATIKGFDANSLYLWAIGQKLPVWYYKLREKSSNYKRQMRYSSEAIKWLEWKAKELGVTIRHAENNPHGELRIGDLSVDGYAELINTVLEYLKGT